MEGGVRPDGVSSGNPQNATRVVNYAIAPNTLNRSTMNDNGDVSAYTPNALNQYQNVAGGEMSYDGNFNLTGLEGFSASYDSASRLVSAQRNEESAQFAYDGLGRCLKRTLNGETTLITYDGWKPIMEWNVWDQQVYFKAWNIYGPGPDEILWRYSDSSGHLRYRLDRMGNVAFVLDWDRVVQEKYTYDAFGEPTVMDGIGENPRPYSWYGNRFMFTGREYFPELGLYDYRNRFYYPILGRFLQSDPVGFGAGDANLFRYCGGDPVNWSDPFGLKEEPKKKEDINPGPSRDSNTWGNSPSAPRSTQGFWSNLDGTPTAPNGGGGGGPASGSRLGNGSGFSYGFIEGYTDEVSVEGTAVPGAPSSFPSGEIGFLPGNITFVGRISFDAGALLFAWGKFVGIVTTDTTPPQTYGITGRLDGIGAQVGYINGDVPVSFAANSPEGLIGPNGGFGTAQGGLGAGPINILGFQASLSAYPTPNGPASTALGPTNWYFDPPGVSTSMSFPGSIRLGPGVAVAFYGITVQTVTLLPGG